MNGPVGAWAADRLRQKGLEVLAYFEGGFRQITNNKRPIVEPADLKGIKMRTPNSALRIKMLTSTVPMPLRSRIPSFTVPFKWGLRRAGEPGNRDQITEVLGGAEVPLVHNHVYTVSYFLMSPVVYKKLPWDLQLLVKQAAYEASLKTIEVGKKADHDLAAEAESKGMKVNQANIPAFVEASKPIWEGYSERTGRRH